MILNYKLPGITSRAVQSDRINTHILSHGPPACTDVVFIHGNCASAGFWDETMVAMPGGFHAIAPDLRGYGSTEPLPVDATLGLDDMVADVRSLVKTLGLSPIHLVGHSMGGGVAMKYAVAFPKNILSITLIDTVSPYGYSGSKGVEGTPIHEDGAPAGAGSVNPDFVRQLGEKEMGVEDPMSPLNVMRQFYVKPPFIYEREEALLEAMLSTRVGDDWYPGNAVPSEHWPGAAPGDKGVNNAISRKYFDASGIVNIDPKPPILWIRGADDLIVSDQAMWDIAALGAMGFVPGWPGEEECPPQPMLKQIRAVLDQYAANGGHYEEVVIDDAGHSPFLEKPQEFNEVFHNFLKANNRE
ncbi:MAG: alpha/beta hydrolase [Candidatus Promineifilaceae bacterium]|nr:alpha/beta hydrolase [Candidatus Promineifilaceae bacterium]